MRQTKIGLLPEDWEVKKLGQVISYISYGFTNPMPSTNSGIWMVTANDVKNGKINFKTARKTSIEAFNKYLTEKSRPKQNDLLLTKDGTLGRVAIVGNEVICINQSVAVIRTNKNLDVFFLKHLLQDNFYQKVMIENAGGSTIKHIYITVVDKMPIVIPPLPEQKAIAEALSDTDAWIESLEQLIAKKRLIKQGAMQELLTPKKDWEVKKLGEVGKIYGGLSGKTKQDFGSGNSYYIPFMNVMKNVVTDKNFIEKVNLKQGETQNRVLKNDLLFNGSSETPEELGISSVLLDDIDNLYLNSFCFGFKIFDENVSPIFLSYIMRSPYGREVIFYLAQGATRYNLSKANFFNLEIAFPKSLSEQTRIATILSDMDAELEALEAQLGKARKVKQGMMQELLTGRVRLV